MEPPQHRTIQTNGIRMHLAEQGEGPLVLLLHGFPESWYSWRHQLHALAAAGYRAVAPDMRGYGQTDAPEAIETYDQVELSSDVVGVLDALGESKAVVVGHDWGAPVAWHCALLHPERFDAVVAMSVAYGGRPPSSPLAILRHRFDGIFFYMLYFQTPGVAEAELGADVRATLRRIYYSISGDAPPRSGFLPSPPNVGFLDTLAEPPLQSPAFSAWFTEEDLAFYVNEFTRTGFRGGLNWYRNFDRSWERTLALAGVKVTQPALFIAGERDPVIAFGASQVERMKTMVPDLRDTLILPGCGHWTQQERPREVNRALLDFLGSVRHLR